VEDNAGQNASYPIKQNLAQAQQPLLAPVINQLVRLRLHLRVDSTKRPSHRNVARSVNAAMLMAAMI
jgi:hypothetical protein